MRIEVRALHIEVEPEVAPLAERRALFAFSRFSSNIRTVQILLKDINGPRGGVDCQVQVRVIGHEGWGVIVSDVDDDPAKAVTSAIARAGRTVTRELERQRSNDRFTRLRRRAS